ncbi:MULTISPECIES: thioredoxin domain-containing protein [Bacillus]|nr:MULTISPECIES: thioredoxin domain-containing protein [Bacillus]MBP1081666.1 protein-disulfide isomerase [Bacillus capparidis]MED1096319.1 thioredoxin domain-containing protein [Bacillus capparidis]
MAKPNIKVKKTRSNQSSKIMFWVLALIFVCFLALIFVVKNSGSTEASAINYTDQPFIGDESAPVSIVEFGDYKCPYCKDFNKSFKPLIEKELVETGQAKFYFMNYSFINVDSTRAAKYAETVYHELGNNAYWKFHNLLYDKQPDDPSYEQIDFYTDSLLKETLKEIATDEEAAKVTDAVQKGSYDDEWDKDMSQVKEAGIESTPTILVNGKKFEGQDFNDLKEMVEKEAKEN